MIAKILHILTALSLLFSTTGLTVSLHYCEDALSGLALFKEASSCHSDGSTCSSSPKSCCKSTSEKDNCCDTETEFFKQDIEKINTQVENNDLDFPIAIVDASQSLTNWNLLKKSNTKFQYYRPPPLIKDIPVLFETFRC